MSVLTLAGGPPRPKTSLYLEALNPRSGAAFEYEVSIDRAAQACAGPRSPGAAGAALLGGREPLLEETLRKAEGRIALPFGLGAGWRSKAVGLLLGIAEFNRLAPLLSPGRSC